MREKISKSSKRHGFTLLELLVVIGIIGILAAIVIVAINPGRQFAQARNAQRWNDVNALLNAVHQYAVDNNGTLPTGANLIPTADPAVNVGSAVGDANLCSILVPTYITGIPKDPSNGTYTDCTNYDSKYKIVYTNSRVTVSATGEQGASISVTR